MPLDRKGGVNRRRGLGPQGSAGPLRTPLEPAYAYPAPGLRALSAGRIAEATSRLGHTDEPVDQIANRAGWKDTTHFIRQFRKVHGATPAAWRREHRARHRAAARG